MTAGNDIPSSGTEIAEIYVRMFSEAALQQVKRFPKSGLDLAEDEFRRVYMAALTLVWVGTLNDTAAESVLSDLREALAVRLQMDPKRLLPQYSLLWRARQPVAAPPGTYAAAPVGARLLLDIDGTRRALRLLTLVLTPKLDAITAAISLPSGVGWRQNLTRLQAACSGARANDDLGNDYQLRFTPNYQEGKWGGLLQFLPDLSPRTTWVEVQTAALEPVRIPLPDSDTHPLGKSVSASGSGIVSSLGTRGESFLDAIATRLLTDSAGEHQLAGLPAAVTALYTTGQLQPDSTALARLVALAKILGLRIPPELTKVPAVSLPEAWANVLHCDDFADGPAGEAAAAAVLPELDGLRCVTARLSSSPRSAILHVLVWGWPTHYRPVHPLEPEPFSWKARDDTGRWYMGTRTYSSAGVNYAVIRVGLTPPLNPRAASLTIMLSGTSGTVSATVPLDWG
jgi:hypothetical protein